jgi:hypothetical protein
VAAGVVVAAREGLRACDDVEHSRLVGSPLERLHELVRVGVEVPGRPVPLGLPWRCLVDRATWAADRENGCLRLLGAGVPSDRRVVDEDDRAGGASSVSPSSLNVARPVSTT